MMPEPFTVEELVVLIEALETWANKDRIAFVLADSITKSIADPADRPEVAAMLAKMRTEMEARSALAHERAVLLQAKLIAMKTELNIASLTESKQ